MQEYGGILANADAIRTIRGVGCVIRAGMSPPGRPKGEYRSAKREGTPVSPPGRPKGEYRSAKREGTPMTSIRRTLLVSLLFGLAAVAALATIATYVETRREMGELFDLQLKQLAYSTRIDDLLRGRPPSGPSPRERRRIAGVSEIVTQIWDRDGVLVYWSQPGAGLPVPITEGYSGTSCTTDACGGSTRAPFRRPRAAGRACARRTPRNRRATRAAHARAACRCLIPLLGVLIWYAVGRGLRPLDALSRAVATRRPDALSPLTEEGVAPGS